LDNFNCKPTYIYTYAFTTDETSLCELEQRSVFGYNPPSHILESPIQIDPSRSPFITGRLDVIYEGSCLQDILEQVPRLSLRGSTFKVVVDKNSVDSNCNQIRFNQRRTIEREVGLSIQGKAELINPEQLYGILIMGDRWMFGEHYSNESIWFKHMQKPQSYSTALILPFRIQRGSGRLTLAVESGLY
jgi:hypothetical protein